MTNKTPTRKIPTTMASQHPDHAGAPYWQNDAYIKTQHETFECFSNFSDFGIQEYKWDWEGKLVDESVIERLFSEHYHFFEQHPIGEEFFLTFRLPNPDVETEFRLGRAFMGILSASVLAHQFQLKKTPLFEVILPMTETAEQMLAIQEAFHEIAQLQHPLFRFSEGTLKHIEMIPLFEQVQTIFHSDEILEKYIDMHKKAFGFAPVYMRPYMARSDPALNSGIVPTVLAIKVALSRYVQFEKRTGIKLFPIIGVAALPFRGGLTPLNVEDFVAEYQGIRTTLIQSAFRYDYPKPAVKKAIAQLNTLLPKSKVVHISQKEEQEIQEIIEIFEPRYTEVIPGLAETINLIASKLPKRRERVQHVGLFGYSRGVGGVKLPRAIGFTAALYSLGVPPEFIGTGRGLQKITGTPLQKVLEKHFRNLRSDLQRAGVYVNKNVLHKLAQTSKQWAMVEEDVLAVEKFLGKKLGPKTAKQKEHEVLTTRIYNALFLNSSRTAQKKDVTNFIELAAKIRQSMG
jgi:phosphoenolpyruvate carboxylase